MPQHISKLLVANRGEIALRVVRTAREMGIPTVVVYAEQDRHCQYVQMADEAYLLSGDTYADTYLNEDLLISILERSGADAVHPGYGFLSEVASFATRVMDAGAVWVGPSPRALKALGDKISARNVATKAKVPPVPGISHAVSDMRVLLDFAHTHGYPLMMKRTDGGGGRGITLVRNDDELRGFYLNHNAVQGGDLAEHFVERFIDHGRHVETQCGRDTHGEFTVYSTRDCSVQRRHQKLIEEAPSPALTEDLRRAMGVAAIKAVRAVNYKNAGTIEFLLDERGSFYFMEMNTRVQVEHPVTEQITGTDIIKEQLRIASGEPMSCASRAPFSPAGHAIEFRINAEDPQHGFRPCPGTITKFEAPAGPGVRVESYVRTGSRISPYYDSLVAKLVVYGQDREEALARGRRALDEFVIEGIETTIAFHRRVLDNAMFCSGDVTTDFIETQMGDVL